MTLIFTNFVLISSYPDEFFVLRDLIIRVNYSHIFLRFCCYTVVFFFLPVLFIIYAIDLESVWFQTFTQLKFYKSITLDMFHILLIVTVEIWNVNKISYIIMLLMMR